MKEYLRIFEEIKATSGRIAKEDLLKEHENVPGLKELFQFIYNPLIISGLAKKKIEKELVDNNESNVQISNIFDAIEYVKVNNTGSDSVIRTVRFFIDQLPEDEAQLAKSILTKDLPIGLSRTTLNKVYGKNFIPKYSVQLASKFEDCEKNLNEEFTVTLKIDGNRITVFNHEDGPIIKTRAGKIVEGLTEIEEQVQNLPKGYAYDGEILASVGNKDSSNYKNSKFLDTLKETVTSIKDSDTEMNSQAIFSLTQKLFKKKGEKIGLDFIVFDTLPIEEFEDGKSKLPYKERIKFLSEIVQKADQPNISLVEILYTGEDKRVIPTLLKEVEDRGLEGLMVNTSSGLYETKRTKGLMKVKSFYTVDLLCVDIQEEVRGGKCGSIKCSYKGNTVDVPILEHALQNLFWNNPETVVGKIVEVKYFEESKNQQGTLSLRFPSFISIRSDKTEPSYS